MLTGGTLTHNKVTLNTNSKKFAERIRLSLVGKRTGLFFITAPFNERVNVKVEGEDVFLTKNEENAFVYEEIRQIVRLLRQFDSGKETYLKNLLRIGRETLGSSFTLFYPKQEAAVVEVIFRQNWVTFYFMIPNTKLIASALTKLVEKTMDHARVLSNDDSVSIHSDDERSLFLSLASFRNIGEVFVDCEVMPDVAVNDFAQKAARTSLRCVSFLEGRHLCITADETYESADSNSANPVERSGLKPLLNTLAVLAKHGDFSNLSAKQREFLMYFTQNPKRIDDYKGTKESVQTLQAIVTKFADEISYAHSQADPKESLESHDDDDENELYKNLLWGDEENLPSTQVTSAF
jgi:hypothetical protein